LVGGVDDAVIKFTLWLRQHFHEVVPPFTSSNSYQSDEGVLNILEVQSLMHRLLHLYIGEQTDSYHRVNVDYQEHQAANIYEGRDRVDESSEDYLQLFEVPE
jgi:hypothetical protein